jgi:hypothetical protein
MGLASSVAWTSSALGAQHPYALAVHLALTRAVSPVR